MASVAGLAVSGIFHWRWLFVLPAILALMTAALMLIFADGMLEQSRWEPLIISTSGDRAISGIF